MDMRANLVTTLAISLFLLVLGRSPATGKIIYADADATGANDGSSWANAYNYLQDALADANSREKPVEIRVAQGIYKPDQGKDQTPGNREATFQLVNGVAIKGGYAGFGEPDPNARDIEAYETILSGDLADNDVEVEDPWDLWDQPSRAENSFHVVTGSGTDATAVFDGFSITGGNADNSSGGGMYNVSCSPKLDHCVFVANSAQRCAGGMYNESSEPTLTKCAFDGNYVWLAGGGGVCNVDSRPALNVCVFRENWGGDVGGGMYNSRSSPRLLDCTFIDNAASVLGGGMCNASGSSTAVTNCKFKGNSAHTVGGGICNYESSAALSNCTFSGNVAHGDTSIIGPVAIIPHGGAIFSDEGDVMLTNCILWDNKPEEIYVSDGTTLLTYSDVRGDWPGEGNIDVDPCFVDPGHWEDPCDTPLLHVDNVWVDGDYHLKSQAGRWEPAMEAWIIDDVTSPCIDAGDPTGPVGLEPFPNGGVINMGAYGGTAQASKSYFGEPVCETVVAGDMNGDCKVDFTDFGIMALHWLEER